MSEQEALEKVVAAWESLSGGYHDGRTIETWMRTKMWPAINDARVALGRQPKHLRGYEEAA